jgi:hypothetical protein
MEKCGLRCKGIRKVNKCREKERRLEELGKENEVD